MCSNSWCGECSPLAPTTSRHPSSVAISCAGPIDEPAGSVSPAALPAWSAFPLRRHVEDLTGLPVVLDTLAGAAAEGELRSATR